MGKLINMRYNQVNAKQCEYIDRTKNVNFPVLVLYVDYDYPMKDDREWLYIAHQTAGIMCHQHYFKGTILTPTTEYELMMYKVNNRWRDSCTSMWSTPLDVIIDYRNQLNSYGLDCNKSYNEFEEGYYPIDIEGDTLSKICIDNFPDRLDELIKWRSDDIELTGMKLTRWKLVILGDNSR